MRDCYLVTFVIAQLVSGMILLFRVPLIRFYVDAPLAVQVGSRRLIIMLSVYFTLAFMEVGSGVLRGLNKSITSTTISLLGSCVLRIIWVATVFAHFQTVESVFISYPISWAVTALCHFIVSSSIRHKLMKQYPEVEQLAD